MSALLDAAQLAEQLGISEEQAKRRTASENWPCVRFSRKTIRYRPEHVEQIIAMHEVEAKPTPGLVGQTTRSRRRSS